MGGSTASEARANLYQLIDETANSHEPILVTSRRNNAVLLAEEDGPQYKRLYFCFRFQACVSRFVKEWLLLLKNVTRSWAGELEAGLY